MSTAPRRPYAPRLPPEERRTQLLDTALEIFAEQGLPAVSIEAIARRADVTRPVVYGVFDDLDDLMHALMEREEARALEQVVSAMPVMPGDSSAEHRDPDQIVVDALTTFLHAVADNPLTWRLILLPVEGTPRSLRDRVERTRGQLLEQIEALIAWGIEERGGPHGVEVELLARSLLALTEEAGRLVLTKPDEFTPERIADFARALITQIARG
jgi:AcrR family transcriptional regulator